MKLTLFISHASEDKDFVEPLVVELKKCGLSVWYDDYSLTIGDSLRREIDKGLSNCTYGVVILSSNFFSKEWPQRELDSLSEKEIYSKRKLILPIWHKISTKEIIKYSPSLADKVGINSNIGVENIAKSIVKVVNQYETETRMVDYDNRKKENNSKKSANDDHLTDILYSYSDPSLPENHLVNNRYIINKTLSVGGFYITYKGYDTLFEKIVLIKEFFPNRIFRRDANNTDILIQEDKNKELDEMKSIFLSSIKTESKLNNIIRGGILDFIEENNTFYRINNYIEGRILSEMIDRGATYEEKEVVPLFLSILTTLQKAHNLGIIHRDIKPNNIIIDNKNNPELIDWDMAIKHKFYESTTSIVTDSYSPPEQYTNNSNLGPWSDIYSCGACMYELLTGKRPVESYSRIESDDLIPPNKIVNMSEHTSQAIMTALSVARNNRPQSAEELILLLGQQSTKEEKEGILSHGIIKKLIRKFKG